MLGDDLARRYVKAGAMGLAVSVEGIFEAEGEAVKGKEGKPYIQTSWFESLISKLLAVELWAIFLYLDFLICKMGVLIAPISWDGFEDQMSSYM